MEPVRALTCILLALAAPAAAFAQAGPPEYPATASTRYIDSERLTLDPPKGIAEYAAAFRTLEAEFAPLEKRLRADAERLQELERRYRALQGSDKIGEMTRLSDEYEAGRRDLLRQKEEADTLYAKRSLQLLRPITDRISAASKRFGQLRRFADLRFAQPADLAPFAQAGAREVTADFVAWYAQNAAQ